MPESTPPQPGTTGYPFCWYCQVYYQGKTCPNCGQAST